MGNLCCAREHTVQFFVQFFYTVKLHSFTKSVGGPYDRQGCFMPGTYGWCIEGTGITNVVHKTIKMRPAKHLALATGWTVRG
jgi:hypothetical protein